VKALPVYQVLHAITIIYYIYSVSEEIVAHIQDAIFQHWAMLELLKEMKVQRVELVSTEHLLTSS